VGVHGANVDRGGDDLDLVERELGAARENLAVQHDHARPVVVEALAVAPLLVGVEVQAAALHRRLLDELDAAVELAQLVVAPRGVGDDLDTVQRHPDVRRVGGEELLAQLDADREAVGRLDRRVAKGHGLLPRDLLDEVGEVVLLRLARLAPRREVAKLALRSAGVVIESSRSCRRWPSTSWGG
jgi:hypothetical protein